MHVIGVELSDLMVGYGKASPEVVVGIRVYGVLEVVHGLDLLEAFLLKGGKESQVELAFV